VSGCRTEQNEISIVLKKGIFTRAGSLIISEFLILSQFKGKIPIKTSNFPETSDKT
jgi:hypothetical protein